MIARELEQPESWWWLSFADENGFRGGVLTRAHGIGTAVTKTHALGINPGGEVRAIEISDENVNASSFGEHADKLLSAEYIDKHLGGKRKMDS